MAININNIIKKGCLTLKNPEKVSDKREEEYLLEEAGK